MCRAVTCKVCGKAGWKGCGMHVDQVLAGVPQAARCPGHPRAEREETGGWMSRILGRR